MLTLYFANIDYLTEEAYTFKCRLRIYLDERMPEDQEPNALIPLAIIGGILAIPLVALGIFWLISNPSEAATSGGGSSKMSNPDSNPEAKIDAKFEPLRETKRSEWKAKGYPESMIEKALSWAEEYTIGMATRITTDPTFRTRVEQELYPKALDMADKWISGFLEFMK